MADQQPDGFRARHQPQDTLPSLPQPGAGTARLALLVAQSDLLEARHLAPDADTREEIDSLLAQTQRVADDLADRLDDEADDERELVTDGGQIKACPECDSSNIDANAGTTFGGTPAAGAYTCMDCGTSFDEPTTRLPLRDSGSCVHGPAKALLEADADELVPDGGEKVAGTLQVEKISYVSDDGVTTDVDLYVPEWAEAVNQDLADRLFQQFDINVRDHGLDIIEERTGEPNDDPDGLVPDGGVRYEPIDSEMEAGDVVVDLASGKSLQVVSIAIEPAGEHPQTRSDDTAAMFDADADEPVYNCVFLPDGDRLSPPSKTYAYPESRLLRYPVERATDGHELQTHLRAAVLTTLLEAATDAGEVETIVDLAGDVYGERLRELLQRHFDRKEVGDGV